MSIMLSNTTNSSVNDSGISTFNLWPFDINGTQSSPINGINASALPDPAPAEGSQRLVDRIIHVLVPLLILGGTIGNMLSLAVFRNTKLRRLSTSCYLTALALSDTGFLLTMLTLWLEMSNVPAYNQPVLCPLITYVGQVCSFLSPWLVVAFTIERFVATCYPLRRASICTVSRARVVVTGLTGIAAMFYSYTLVMAGNSEFDVVEPDLTESDYINNISVVGTTATVPNVTQYKCGAKPAYLTAMNALNWVDLVITLVAPLVIIIVLNVLIGRAVMRFERVRRRMTSLTSNPTANDGRFTNDEDNSWFNSQDGESSNRLNGSDMSMIASTRLQHSSSNPRHGYHRTNSPGGGTPPGMYKGGCNQRSVRGRYQIKITKMLLMISSVFLALNTPSYLVRLLGFVCGHECTESALFYNAQQWSQLAYYLNFAINFLLYCASGQNFRKSLRHLVVKALSRAGHARHFSRQNTSNTTLSTATVTTIHNGTHGASGMSAASTASRPLPLSAVTASAKRGATNSARLESRAKPLAVKIKTDKV